MPSHLFTAKEQPATRFRDTTRDGWPLYRRKPHQLRTCRACGRRRWCKNLVVQVYYDDVRYYCKPGKGCRA